MTAAENLAAFEADPVASDRHLVATLWSRRHGWAHRTHGRRVYACQIRAAVETIRAYRTGGWPALTGASR